MFLSRNKKNNVYPVNPSFAIEKWGLMGSKLYRRVFMMKFKKNIGENTHEMPQSQKSHFLKIS